jgi:2-hydroxyglutarate dehydrogenase
MRSATVLRRALQRYSYREPDYNVDNLVVGGGVIGLAVAAKFRETRPNETTIVVERHGKVSQPFIAVQVQLI